MLFLGALRKGSSIERVALVHLPPCFRSACITVGVLDSRCASTTLETCTFAVANVDVQTVDCFVLLDVADGLGLSGLGGALSLDLALYTQRLFFLCRWPSQTGLAKRDPLQESCVSDAQS